MDGFFSQADIFAKNFPEYANCLRALRGPKGSPQSAERRPRNQPADEFHGNLVKMLKIPPQGFAHLRAKLAHRLTVALRPARNGSAGRDR